MSKDQAEKTVEGGQPFSVKRLWPLAILVAGFVLFFVTGLDQYITFEALREHRSWLLNQVENNTLVTALAFMAIYIVVVAFSLPGGAVLTIVGGFLFGLALGTVFVVVSATIGATALFLVAKTTIGDALKARMGPWLQKMEQGFQENAFNYLLAMRLIPIFPFFVVNLVPAFLGVRLKTYFLATLFGIIPGSVVYIQVGAGLGSIFDSGEEFTAAGILTPDVVLALVGLAILSLLPILYKKFKERNAS
ncbi:MAG: TVP38/TMEM64 family protein [Rhodospirillaceae bacterium]|nr:TVP38/TMEM64 family protein [Rhodospirillaceae bacterium]MDD9915369.1 TVP38/TMEM64 family protein [Rhodospirillaceae bacterium]MDD9928168.1 TVP38/TMEM64 family protein [Rhodospirillaceae bacterium]